MRQSVVCNALSDIANNDSGLAAAGAGISMGMGSAEAFVL